MCRSYASNYYCPAFINLEICALCYFEDTTRVLAQEIYQTMRDSTHGASFARQTLISCFMMEQYHCEKWAVACEVAFDLGKASIYHKGS